MNQRIKCPVCDKEMESKSLIYHFKKKAVFEVYNAYTSPVALDIPHQKYIEKHSSMVTKFTI